MTWPNIIGLGEMMNFPAWFSGDAKMLAEIAATHARRQDGRRPLRLARSRPAPSTATSPAARPTTTRARGRRRHRPRAAGHEGDAALGSAWYDVAAQVKAVTELGLDSAQLHPVHRRQPFRHAGQRGPHGPRRAPCHRAGLKPMTAIQMATLNTAQHFGLERELGSITPGRRADFLITSTCRAADRRGHRPRRAVLAENGRLASPTSALRLSAERQEHRPKHGQAAAAADFDIAAPKGATRSRAARHRRHREPGADRALEADLAVEDGLVAMDRRRDVCQIAAGRAPSRHRRRGQRLRLGLRL
jgi:adenine deaminase